MSYLSDRDDKAAVYREFRNGRSLWEIASYSNREVEAVEAVLRDILGDLPRPPYNRETKTMLPDLPRCSAKTKGRGGAPCNGPATRRGLCPAHFLQLHGHLTRNERGPDMLWPPIYQYCKRCGKQWQWGDSEVLKEVCPKAPG